MAKTATLEDFIKNYVRNKSLTESNEGYSAWLKKNGADSAEIVSNGISSALASLKKASAAYGKNAEKLSSMGLSNSGYADYINSTAKRAYADRLSTLGADYARNEAKNLNSYESYLQEKNQEYRKTLDTAIKSLKKSGIMDYQKAYEYALTLGLSESDAKGAAEESTSALIESTRKKVIENIILNHLGSVQTKEYAISLGLDESLANELGEIAYDLNESVENGKYSESYLDYLREQAKKNANK